MGYKNLKSCLNDLEKTNQLIRVDTPVSAYLEVAEIHRRMYAVQGPALLFTNVTNCSFPIASNIYGTIERTRWIFRNTLAHVETLMRLKVDPMDLLKNPSLIFKLIPSLKNTLPQRTKKAPVLTHQISISQLPQVVSWPKDGGAFITLPQVYTEDPNRKGIGKSNLGMYRVQLSGNDYADNEVGLHYQIHRGIGVHQTAAIQKGQPLKVRISVGGPPALALAAVMPLPEGLPELFFAGVLSGSRLKIIKDNHNMPLPAEADFVISGTIDDTLKNEGPFGDHLGYYSLTHPFPVVNVENVWHRSGAIWPITVVGRPPQEDTSFGEFIHELTGPVIPSVIPGVKAVHAVDAAGVHPLMLAFGSERYTPFQKRTEPMEILTQANALLGQGQISLTKYLMIMPHEDCDGLHIHNVKDYLTHLLERIDLTRDLHFQTCTTIDTLDYSGAALNKGSKVVFAAAGKPIRQLQNIIPSNLTLPEGFDHPHVVIDGILAIQAPPHQRAHSALKAFCQYYSDESPINRFPLIVLVDDSEFTSRTLNNFLWVTFTRSNPATDINGIESFTDNKHWGCRGSLVIDARHKEHHAPVLEGDPEISKKVDELIASDPVLKKYLN